MCIYIGICIHMYIGICIHVYIGICIHMYIGMCIPQMHINIHCKHFISYLENTNFSFGVARIPCSLVHNELNNNITTIMLQPQDVHYTNK